MRKEELIEELDTWKRLLIKDWIEQDEQTFKEIMALLKKEVTEEWIEEKAMQISHAFNDIHIVGMEQAKDFIRSLVEEIRK